MLELLDLIHANPWPFAAGLFAVVAAIIAETFGTAIKTAAVISPISIGATRRSPPSN